MTECTVLHMSVCIVGKCMCALYWCRGSMSGWFVTIQGQITGIIGRSTSTGHICNFGCTRWGNPEFKTAHENSDSCQEKEEVV